MGIVVGGEKAWRVKRKGDVVVAFHWVNKEPAMVLFPARPNTAMKPSACVIALSAAFKYAEPTGYPTPYCIKQAATFALAMGMDTTSYTIHQIADAVLEGIEDLLDMPPEPQHAFKKKPAIMGEMTLRSGGRKIGGGDLIADADGLPELHIDLPAGSTLH